MGLKRYFLTSKSFCSAILLSITAIGLQSCLKEFPTKADDLGWKPSIAAPLATGTLTLKDLLLNSDTLNSYLQTKPDQSLRLVYKRGVLSQNAQDRFVLPDESDSIKPYSMDTSIIDGFNASGSFPPPPIVINDTMSLDLPDLGHSQLDSLFLKGGVFDLDVVSTFKDSIELYIDIPGYIQAGGNSFHLDVNMNHIPGKPLPVYYSNTMQLSNSYVAFQNNRLPYQLIINLKHIRSDGHRTTTKDQLRVNFKFRNIAFSKILGNFGGLDIPVPKDSLTFEGLGSSYAGNITVDSVSLGLKVTNSFGIPIALSFDQFNAREIQGPNIPIYKGPGIYKKVIRPAPSIGDTSITNIVFDNSNSNLINIVKNVPKSIKYSISDTVVSRPHSFLVDTDAVKLDLDVEMPLNLGIKNLALRDTFDLNLGDTSKLSLAESGSLKINTINYLPFGVQLQVYFYDKVHKKIVDSLLDAPKIILDAATGDPSTGHVTSPKSTSTDIMLTHARLLKLQKATSMITKAIINTATTDAAGHPVSTVKFYADYKLILQAGLKISKIDVLRK